MRPSSYFSEPIGIFRHVRNTTICWHRWADRCGELFIYVSHISALLSLPPSPEDIRVPASLAFHICDIYLEELDKVLGASPSYPPAPLSILLTPFFTLAARTQAKTTYKHTQETIFDPLFFALKTHHSNEVHVRKRPKLDSIYSNIAENSCISEPTDRAIASEKVRSALLRRLFDVASEEETRDSNRRKMYAVFRAAKEDDDDTSDS